jgi:hypothetical protein
MTTFTRTTLWSKKFVRKDNGHGKETWSIDVSSINGGAMKVYGRVWIESEKYSGPTKEGFVLDLAHAEEFLETIAEAVKILKESSEKKDAPDTAPRRRKIAPRKKK